MQAHVELVKAQSHVLVVTLPEHGNAVAFASAATINTQCSTTLPPQAPGRRVTCTLAAAAAANGAERSEALADRLLLSLKPPAPGILVKALQDKAAKGPKHGLTGVHPGTVTEVHALYADVQVGKRTAHLHVCELPDARDGTKMVCCHSQSLSSHATTCCMHACSCTTLQSTSSC